MDFKSFWYGMEQGERVIFAESVERSAGYLQLVAGGFRRASPALALTIEDKSAGKVTRHDTRPDIFGEPPPVASPLPSEGRAAA